MRVSNSSSSDISILERIHYLYGVLAAKCRSSGCEQDFLHLEKLVDEYRRIALTYTGKKLEECRVLEIGFGQRPYCFFWLANLGVDIIGVDLEQPMLRGDLGELKRIVCSNGVFRALKTFIAFWLIDRRERGAFKEAVEEHSRKKFGYPLDQINVSDVSNPEFWQQITKLDFVYSFEVLEHIPRESIRFILSEMARKLRPEGVAHVRLTSFAGITGGAIPDWYPNTVSQDIRRRAEPWEHLRKRRFRADAYMNGQSIKDYRAMFLESFEIKEEHDISGPLGRQYLTPEIAAELSHYDTEDLLSNQFEFVLKPRTQP
jgi:SAM-dependent methyltransferase